MEHGRDPTFERLRAASAEAAGMNWSPYTRFAVYAAVLTSDGRTFAGSNVENANISLSRHAEEVAILNAIAQGALPPGDGLERRRFVRAVYTSAPPCGSCRQIIHEFATEDCVVYVDEEGAEPRRVPLAELFPDPFGPPHQAALIRRGEEGEPA